MKALTIGLCIVGLACFYAESVDTTTVATANLDGGLTGNECYGQAHGALIPYPGDCTKYLVCEWYSGTVMNCPSGLHFNPVACVCDWPTAAGCIQGGSPTQAPPSSTPTPSPSPTPSPLPSASPSTSPSPTPSPSPSSSPSPSATTTLKSDEGLTGNECYGHAHGALIPYPGDCTKYLVCEWYNGTVMNCPSGLHFNPVACVCDWPTAAGCIEGGSPTQAPPSPTPSPTPTTSSSPIPTAGPDENICLDQKDGTLFPYPWDCAWYIRCEEDGAVVLPCEDGWLFNPILLICDYPENAGSEPIPYPTSPGPTPWIPITTPTTDTTPTPTIPSTTSSPQLPSSPEGPKPTPGPDNDVCNDQKDGTLFPYPWDCAWYIRCEEDDAVVLPCEDGWLFNPILLICDYPENAGCEPIPYPTSPRPTPWIPTTTPTTDTTPNPTISSTTSSPQLPSSPESPKPTPGPNNDVCNDQKDGTLFPYPWDCAWYIRCEEYDPVVLPCEDGWLFNPILLICDYPENAGCEPIPYPTSPRPTPWIPTTTPTTDTTPNPTISSTTSSPQLPSSPESPKPTPGPNNDVCNDQKDGTLFPYPWDCAWYIRCEEDDAVVLPCEDGWLFNPILLICDYPENAGCEPIPYPTSPRPTPWIPITTPTTDTTPNPTISSTTSSPQLPSSSESPKPTPGPNNDVCNDQKDGALFPYPWDCAWYIRCEANKPIVQPCEDGWLFNAILLICDYPENVRCTAIPYPTTTTSSLATPPTQRPIPITTSTPTPTSDPATSHPGAASSSQGPIPTPGTDNEVCINQIDGALFPYPWDCDWYIRCEEDKPIVLPCEGGWQFNPILLTCEHPESAGCTASPYPTTIFTVKPTESSTFHPIITSTPYTSTSPPYVGTGICANLELGTLLPYPGKCSLYIVCEEKSPIAYTCDEGLEFNAELKICQSPEEAGCSIIKTTPITTTETGSTPITTTPSSTVIGTDTTPITVQSSTTPSTGVGICASHPLGDLIPYPGNCSQYILCELPAPIALECLDGLEFNAKLQVCESAEDAGCSNTTPTIPNTTTPIPSTPPGLTGICRGQEEGDLIPYPNDCTKYIICENPIPIAQKCGADLHFNADLGICDEPDSAGCSDGGSGGSSTLPPQTTTPLPSIPGLIGVCKDHQVGDFIPYPGSCTKYIRCEVPVPIAQTCKSGLFFNEVLGICDTIGSTDCPGGATTISPPPTTPTTQRPPSMTGICRDKELGTLIPYPHNCSKYIVCENPVPIAIACNDGLQFNAELQICDDPLAAGCEPPETTTTAPPTSNVCCGHPIGSLVPYPDDCTQYIRCEYPIPIALSCCSGFHFNAVSEKCETIEDANCKPYTASTTPSPLTCATLPNGSLLPYEGDCKKYYFCSNSESVLLPCPVGTIFSTDEDGCVPGFICPTTTTSTTITTTTTAAPPTCATQPNGTLLPVEGDCKKYNFCSNGESVTLPCPQGTVFSQINGACMPGNAC